jgi:hypothetical protein
LDFNPSLFPNKSFLPHKYFHVVLGNPTSNIQDPSFVLIINSYVGENMIRPIHLGDGNMEGILLQVVREGVSCPPQCLSKFISNQENGQVSSLYGGSFSILVKPYHVLMVLEDVLSSERGNSIWW